jgi:hypothetical protein
VDSISEHFEYEIVNHKDLWRAEILRKAKVSAENAKINKAQMELSASLEDDTVMYD